MRSNPITGIIELIITIIIIIIIIIIIMIIIIIKEVQFHYHRS